MNPRERGVIETEIDNTIENLSETQYGEAGFKEFVEEDDKLNSAGRAVLQKYIYGLLEGMRHSETDTDIEISDDERSELWSIIKRRESEIAKSILEEDEC